MAKTKHIAPVRPDATSNVETLTDEQREVCESVFINAIEAASKLDPESAEYRAAMEPAFGALNTLAGDSLTEHLETIILHLAESAMRRGIASTTPEAALQSPEITKILREPALNRHDVFAGATALEVHIARGCRLARLEGFEDGASAEIAGAVILQHLPDWIEFIKDFRTHEPYPEDMTDQDEKTDHDGSLSNMAGFYFRAGELAERARNPQPAGVPVMPFDYRLGDDDHAVADALDRAAQLARDEEDGDIRRTEAACRAKQSDADYSHITTMSMAMRVSRRFPERIRQDMPREYKALHNQDQNFELRELMAFCFRAGQLSGWR